MKIEYVKGDFIDGPETFIVHGCNAQGVQGRGAALAIKTRLPYAFKQYRSAYEVAGLPLGSIVWAVDDAEDNPNPKVVGNMITQDQWHPSYGRNVDYEAVRNGFKLLNEQMQDHRENIGFINRAGTVVDPYDHDYFERVGMVKIGAGLGGGDWEIIEKIIEEESTSFIPVVYLLD
jgi:O-acetyl-ADP-ribose deacetylase (regulator of RNase III)